ncbi:homocysteine S-methyltransferase [Leekyejoonella antrihumi]|uniref:Homocysteine S-methyltransferase n=1 Tax=Leekyejoonella antrihumi TaxID=1660198 RepID=A0A563E492_9MICO|nr:homocysteine S-methyltransferase [Leekyejoonella antrihumi]TWP37235.1 homocysteine S-methyltransferase [Leekyejoonella antrihumi]
MTGAAAPAGPAQIDGAPVVLLDGGMSNALEDRGHDLSDALWTARLLRDAPAEIAAVHRAYFDAGARVATTASYQASLTGLVAAGLGNREAQQLIGSSVTIARNVRDSLASNGTRRWVAASVGPYGATLADGSEYRGHYGLSNAQLRDFHLPRLELLAAAGPDLFAVETIPDIDEAEVLVDLLDEVGLPAWLSFSILGRRTRAGQHLSDAFAVAASAETVFAVGVNCCPPADVLPALETAHAVTGKPTVAYPNSGEQWSAAARGWQGAAAYDVGLAPGWVAAGAAYVGGCCRVGPSTIAALATILETE